MLSDVIRSLIDSLTFPGAGHGLDIGERSYFLQTVLVRAKLIFVVTAPPVHVMLGTFSASFVIL